MRRVHLCVILALSIVSTGCVSSAYNRLVSEREQPLLRRLLEARDTLTIREIWYPTRFADDPVINIILREMGNTSSDRLVIFIHGAGEGCRTWRLVVSNLAADHRLLLVDLPGCGDSEAPDPDLLSVDGYSPTAMAYRVAQALTAYVSEHDAPHEVTLVGHSLGGAVVLRMLGCQELRDRYDVFDRVDRLVILSGLDVEFVNVSPMLHKLATVSLAELWLGNFTGLLDKQIANGVWNAVWDPEARALREDADVMEEILTDSRKFRVFQAILRQAIPLKEGKLDWDRIRPIVADYANVDIPCLILWGQYDDALPLAMGYKLAGQIPHAQIHVVPDCKHNMQLEHPVLCAEAIRSYSRSDSGFSLKELPRHVPAEIGQLEMDLGQETVVL